MEGADDVVNHGVCEVVRLAEPRGHGLIDEAHFAVAEGANVPASVAPDALAQFLLEMFPSLFRRLRLEARNLSEFVRLRDFRHLFPHKHVVDRWIPMLAG